MIQLTKRLQMPCFSCRRGWYDGTKYLFRSASELFASLLCFCFALLVSFFKGRSLATGALVSVVLLVLLLLPKRWTSKVFHKDEDRGGKEYNENSEGGSYNFPLFFSFLQSAPLTSTCPPHLHNFRLSTRTSRVWVWMKRGMQKK